MVTSDKIVNPYEVTIRKKQLKRIKPGQIYADPDRRKKGALIYAYEVLEIDEQTFHVLLRFFNIVTGQDMWEPEWHDCLSFILSPQWYYGEKENVIKSNETNEESAP